MLENLFFLFFSQGQNWHRPKLGIWTKDAEMAVVGAADISLMVMWYLFSVLCIRDSPCNLQFQKAELSGDRQVCTALTKIPFMHFQSVLGCWCCHNKVS